MFKYNIIVNISWGICMQVGTQIPKSIQVIAKELFLESKLKNGEFYTLPRLNDIYPLSRRQLEYWLGEAMEYLQISSKQNLLNNSYYVGTINSEFSAVRLYSIETYNVDMEIKSRHYVIDLPPNDRLMFLHLDPDAPTKIPMSSLLNMIINKLHETMFNSNNRQFVELTVEEDYIEFFSPDSKVEARLRLIPWENMQVTIKLNYEYNVNMEKRVYAYHGQLWWARLDRVSLSDLVKEVIEKSFKEVSYE